MGELTKRIAVLVIIACSCAPLKPSPLYRSDGIVVETDLPRVRRDDLLSEISLYHGVPYLEGGTTIRGVDCSGLVFSVFASVGVKLPRTVIEQYGCGIPVPRGRIRTGDLVFFGKGNVPTHVGIAISPTEMVHASSSRGVVIESIEKFSEVMRLVGVRRVVRLR